MKNNYRVGDFLYFDHEAGKSNALCVVTCKHADGYIDIKPFDKIELQKINKFYSTDFTMDSEYFKRWNPASRFLKIATHINIKNIISKVLSED